MKIKPFFSILFGHFDTAATFKTSHFYFSNIIFVGLLVSGLFLLKLHRTSENEILLSNYVLGLPAANIKLPSALSDQSVAAEQMASLSPEVSAQQSRFVTLSKAFPSCWTAKKMTRPVPALRHPEEAGSFSKGGTHFI